MQVRLDFSMSPWYSDIVYVLQNLQAPARLSKTRARSVKLKAAKFCILHQYLYWKDPRNILTTLYSFQNVDVFVTSECIQLCILCLVPRCLFWDVSVMYLSHVLPQFSYQEVL